MPSRSSCAGLCVGVGEDALVGLERLLELARRDLEPRRLGRREAGGVDRIEERAPEVAVVRARQPRVAAHAVLDERAEQEARLVGAPLVEASLDLLGVTGERAREVREARVLRAAVALELVRPLAEPRERGLDRDLVLGRGEALLGKAQRKRDAERRSDLLHRRPGPRVGCGQCAPDRAEPGRAAHPERRTGRGRQEPPRHRLPPARDLRCGSPAPLTRGALRSGSHATLPTGSATRVRPRASG